MPRTKWNKHNSRTKQERTKLIYGLTLEQVDQLLDSLKASYHSKHNARFTNPTRHAYYGAEYYKWHHRRAEFLGEAV